MKSMNIIEKVKPLTGLNDPARENNFQRAIAFRRRFKIKKSIGRFQPSFKMIFKRNDKIQEKSLEIRE